MTDLSPRHRIVCADCSRRTDTIHEDETRCLPCRAKGRTPWAALSKHDRDEILRDQVCPGGDPR